MPARDSEKLSAPLLGREALDAITPERWAELRRNASLLRSAGRGPLSKEAAERLAVELDVHWATIYRWHQRFSESRTISSLQSRGVGFPKGSGRLSAEQEAVIAKC